jgi:hypothetical protein
MTTIVIVEKTGVLKNLTIKEYSEEELYKKCGFKKADDFGKQTEWSVKIDGKKYLVSMYGKIDGKANTENKYDFPPPVDSTLFFGNCALVCQKKNEASSFELCSMSSELWEKMYEKLFGGFENLVVTCAEDEEEVDELENIPAEKKTKNGYLKDGFVVDSGDEDYESEDSEDMGDSEDVGDEDEEEINLEDIGSELSEDDYDYSDDDDDDGGVVKENVFTTISKKKD